MNRARAHRGTLFVEEAEILRHETHAGDQFVLRVAAPKCAAHARPGQFAHITVDPQRPLRRPISIMRASPAEGWVDFLYKVVGEGTRLLTRRREGETLSLLGPIGRPFEPHRERPRTLLLGGGVGMPPMICLAEALKDDPHWQPLVLLASEVPFPFTPRPSGMLVPGIPEGVIAAMPLLEDWGVASRLASRQGFPGCHPGFVTDLAREWLAALSPAHLTEVELFACGPHPMLEATARLAADYDLPCQVSLEEFMACGVGGCAGCTVPVQTPEGTAMKRVCVDGPVFPAAQVFFD